VQAVFVVSPKEVPKKMKLLIWAEI